MVVSDAFLLFYLAPSPGRDGPTPAGGKLIKLTEVELGWLSGFNQLY